MVKVLVNGVLFEISKVEEIVEVLMRTRQLWVVL